MFKKFLVFFLLFSLLYLTIPINAFKVSAIQNVWMEILPRKISSSATYKFHFTIEKKLEVHKPIILFFGAGTTLVPPLPEDPIKRHERLVQIIEAMSIGLSPCSACQGDPIIKFKKDGTVESMEFNTHLDLDPSFPGYEHVVVTVPAVCGFTTPAKPGFYIYGVSTFVEQTKAYAPPFEIVETHLGVPEGMPTIEVLPVTCNSNATYIITFNVGRGGWLPSGAGLIKLKFPIETKFSKLFAEIKPENILVNNVPVGNPINGTKTLINFITPVEIKDSGKVTIVLNEKVGIFNPAGPGSFTVEVATSAEPEWVKSETYSIQKGISKLTINPIKVGRNAEYVLSFAFSIVELKMGGAIIVKFPPNVQLPSNINNEYILINEEKPILAEKKGTEFVIFIAKELHLDDGVEIIFKKECGIRNPVTPGKIQLQYRPSNYDIYEATSFVEIIEGKLEVGEITIDPRNANEIASYIIPVTLGDKNGITMLNTEALSIQFPTQTFLPEIINLEDVRLNYVDKKVIIPIHKVIKSENIIEVYPSSNIPQASQLLITFYKEIGIRNPEDTGQYQLSVFTTKETEPQSSEYNILPPLPITQIIVTGGVMGKNDWYTEPPLVKFICSDSTAETILIWDNKVNQSIIFDGKEKPLDTGQYETILHYYSKSVYGQEKTKDYKFKVDTVKPEVVIDSPKETKTITNISPIEITGRTTGIKTILYGIDVIQPDELVFINDEKIPVVIKEDQEKQIFSGEFNTKLDLKQGENSIHLLVEDYAGNSVTKDYIVIFDNIPPVLELIEPKQNSVILTSKLTIKGKTEPDIQLLVNGEIVYIEEDGKFLFETYMKNIGKQIFNTEATDSAGNITLKELNLWFGYTIILQIGSREALTNATQEALDVAPYIKSGSTMVPFRFIGQALGAEIGWQLNSQKFVEKVSYRLGNNFIELTIGSKTAKVNGKNVSLLVPPEIIKGRTFIPLRFVTENLGAEVLWEAKEQRITIKYPKLD